MTTWCGVLHPYNFQQKPDIVSAPHLEDLKNMHSAKQHSLFFCHRATIDLLHVWQIGCAKHDYFFM